MNRIHSTYSSSSFTLVEILIVIGILAIITAAVVIVLNPAELLRQSRDTTRMSDLASIHSALSLYLTQSTQPSLGTASTVYISLPDTSQTCINLSLPTLPSGYTYHCVSQASSSLITGSGWLPINLASSSIGSLPTLPIDPTNTTSSGLYYTYTTNGTGYELTTILESTKYRLGGSQDKASHDGGSTSYLYEQGNNLTLHPLTDSGLVGYWTFDEGSGTTAYDTSGYNNNGILTNGPTWQSQSNCKTGGCLSFDGVDDWVSVQNSSSSSLGTSDFTISTWVKFSRVSSYAETIIGNKTVGGWETGWVLFKEVGGRIILRLGTDTSFLHTFGPVLSSDNVFYHIVVKRSGSQGSVYINGINSTFSSDNMTLNVNRATPIGIAMSIHSYPFQGYIDNTHVYNRALSDAEVKALYNATK